MNLNIEKKTEVNKNTNFLIYTIENSSTPYVYYHMIKDSKNIIKMPQIFIKSIKDCEDFMIQNFNNIEYKYVGTIFYNDENIVIYELYLIDQGIINTYYDDSWWKVLPFEILNTQKVLQFDIDQYCISFFKNNPQFFYIFNNNIKYEVPIIAYLGIGNEELNEQILLINTNYKKGFYGKGYYFITLEEAYYNSLYDTDIPVDNIIKLPNNNYIMYNTILDNNTITIKNNKFYFNNTFIGDVPKYCNIKNRYIIVNFNNNYIYLQSNKPIKNKYTKNNSFIKKTHEGYIMRYVLFLKNTSYNNKKGYDSYFSFKKKPVWFPYYMVKNENQISLISYHNSKYKNIEVDYIFNKNKNINILIK